MSRRQLATVVAALALCVALFVWFVASAPGPQTTLVGAGRTDGEPVVSGTPSSTELVEHPKAWDGKRIAFTGEAVSCVMVRGNYAWVHLNDDSYAQRSVEAGGHLSGYNSGQAVWVPASLASAITVAGGYKHQGDLVRVEGVFHAACAEHGGDMDIHADVLTVQRPGRDIAHPLEAWKLLCLLVLVPLAGGMWWLHELVAWRHKVR
jgi:PDZ domain-containing secreted protein